MLGSATLVSVATSLSRIGGLVREQLFAALLGAGFYSDAFVVAFRVPNLLRDLLAEGALSTAFVPTFTTTLVQRGQRQAFALGNLVLTTLLFVTAAVVLVGWLFADPIVYLIAPGFADTPGKLDLTATLTRVLLPFLPMVALAAVFMGMLNAQQRFFVPAVAPALFNAAAIVVGLSLLWAGVDGRAAVIAWALAVLLGGLLQMGVQILPLRASGWRYRPRFHPHFDDPQLRQIMRLMAPAVIGLSATQLNILINNILASQLEQGSPSWINYAFRLMQLPIGVFGVAVATVNLAAVSRHAAAEDHDAFRATLAASLKLVAFLTLPATAGLVALREPIIGLLYEHGRFSAYDTARTAEVLSLYAIGLVAYAGVKVMAPAFYALHAPRVPLFASIAAVVCNVVANLLLYRRLGAPGLALGTSIGALVNAGMLYLLFVQRYGSLDGRDLAWQVVRVAAAALPMAIVCRLVARALEQRFGSDSVTADLLVTLPPILLGILLYFGLAHLLRLHETRQVVQLLRRVVRRR
ncbi:MAG: murein biosynthesis integral membrane protein MurJ [Candidatus Latescibacterota bacterium]|nr:MAG: murein biosynthesis integral membrane protein MurJ [Candidatus Latescibacterota bacterium]